MHLENGSAETNIFAFVNAMEVFCELSSAYCWETPELGSIATIKNNFRPSSANRIISLIKEYKTLNMQFFIITTHIHKLIFWL